MSEAFVLEQRSSTDLVVGRMLNDVDAVLSVVATITDPVRFPGETTTITYVPVIAPEGTEDSVTYSSDDVAVATVDSSGNVTVVGIGTCNISVEVFGSGPQLNSNSVIDSAPLIVLVENCFAPEQRDSTDLIVDFMFQATLGSGAVYPSSIATWAFGTASVTTTASFTPTGWASDAYGTPIVFNSDQPVTVSGFTEEAFGTAWVSSFQQFVTDASWTSSEFGTALVYNSDQSVENGGWRSSEFGNPTVFDPLQTITVGGIEALDFPEPYVADYYQYIDHSGQGIAPGSIGAQLVAFRVRYVEPPWFYTNAFGTPTVVAVSITPDTWRSHVVATGAVVTHSQRAIDSYGVASASAVPWPTVINKNAYLCQKGWDALRVQSPTVYNRTQYIGADPYALNSPPNTYGTAQVANRNRTLDVATFVSSRMGRRTDTYVANAARAIAPEGLESLEWGPETFISHRIRYVYTQTWQSSRFTRWGIVYNDAFLVEPVSIGPTVRVGRPDPVFSNLQTLVQYNVVEQTVFGTAFVAYRIRTVYPADIPYPTAFFPTVRWNPQPIRPAGILPEPLDRPFGHVVLSRFMRNAQPRSFNVHQDPWVGNPRVENRNRVVRPQPVVRGEHGRQRVFNKDQYAPAGGETFLRFGATVVEFRTRRVTIGGIDSFRMPFTHWIRNAVADPPGAQLIEPFSIYLGIAANAGIVENPIVTAMSLWPTGFLSFESGSATVRGTDIRPRSITDLDRFGEALVSGAQYVFAEAIPRSDLFVLQLGAPQCSPYTIYAPSGDRATAQARANHPIGDPPNAIGPEQFGEPEVSGMPRYVVPGALNSTHPRFGNTAVALRLRYLRPPAIRGPRFGPVIILNVPQFIGFDEDTPGYLGGSAVGDIVVSRPPANPQTVIGIGEDLSQYGDTHVDLKNREIAPEGIVHRGNPEQGFTNPWGDALVGYPREYVLSLDSQTLWGTLVIEYLNRQVWPTGWDSLTLIDDSLNDFRYRMRVTRRNPVNTASGIATTTGVGTPMVSFSVRTLTVMPIWPGYTGMASVAMTVTPAGWDSFEAGDIDEWVAGTVKAHGDEMFAPGYPRLGHGVQPASISDGAQGSTRFAWRVQVSGMPPVGFDGPSVTDEHGCSRRVVTTWPIQAPTFSSPVVTQ